MDWLTMSIYMAKEDVFRLTGKKRFSAQRKRLAILKIQYDLAATGEPLVRTDRNSLRPPVTDRGFNWGALNGK
jgi:hypothetical protein